MRRRFAFDGKTDKGKTFNRCDCAATDGSNKRDAITGYLKTGGIVFLLVISLFVRVYVVELTTVVGDSMNDNFKQGDILMVKKFNTTEIERYDVVIVKVEGQNVIKRVIGLPGEEIYIADGSVFVNGRAVDGDYGFFTECAGVAEVPYLLDESEYFIMGDNRSGSYDSRDFGPVNHSQISGIAIMRLWPVWCMGKV